MQNNGDSKALSNVWCQKYLYTEKKKNSTKLLLKKISKKKYLYNNFAYNTARIHK